MNNNVQSFIEYFSKKILNGKASFFVGSGLSRSAGYVGWSELLDDKARELGLDVNKENDLITLAQYYINNKNRTKINESIKEFFSDDKGNVTRVHNLICNMPITSIWTTNYDSLLERQYDINNIPYSIVTNDKSYKDIKTNSKVIVHKIHGTYSSPGDCVITRQDYENYSQNFNIVLSQLKAEMCSKSFLFLGYGFRDTDINHIFSKIRQIYNKENPHQHYCIMKRVSITENGIEKNIDEYNYELKKEEYFISDMKCYGIETILIDDFSEITDILEKIRKKVYSKSILISGSCEEYNEGIAKITTQLTEKLIKSGYKIVTGFGKNIGNMIVEGYFNGCYRSTSNPIMQFSEVIKIIPFPFKNKTNKVKEIYSNLRENMADITTIQIIICGKNEKTDSNGVYNEYQISCEKNNLIIPIPSTGGTAKIIWDELINSGSESFSTEFKSLDDTILVDEIINCVLKIIQEGK